MKALLYCTKAKPYLVAEQLHNPKTNKKYPVEYNLYSFNEQNLKDIALNGFIVAECDIDKVEKIKYYNTRNSLYEDDNYILNVNNDFFKKTCLCQDDLEIYLQGKNGYALHLSNVKAFDKPKDINSFYTNYRIDKYGITSCNMLMKAPQNMCRVIDFEGKPYILISIHPEWLCKILNGEKTIEVRKQILNCLKEMV